MATAPGHLSLVDTDNPDYRLHMWVIYWGAHALLEDPLRLHHANIFTPEPYTFAYSHMELTQTLLALPTILAWYNPVLTYNYLLLVSMVLGGTGAYLLARYLTDHRAAALLGAGLWVFNPARFGRWAQMQLFSDQWLPWLALCLLLWIDSVSAAARPPGDSGLVRRQRWVLLAAGFFCLHALTGAHNAVFGALMTAAILLYYGISRRLWSQRDAWVGLLVIATICIVVLGPFFYPYLLLQERMYEARISSAEVLDGYSARLQEMVTAWSHFYLWVDRATGWPSSVFGCCPRTLLFPGAVPLALALFGLLWTHDRRWRSQKFWLFFFTLCFLLSFGPALGLYRVIGFLPGARLIRVPSRFMMPANLALAMLAAYGAAALAQWVSRDRRESAAPRILHSIRSRPAWVLGLLAVVFAFEASYAPMATHPFSPDPPAVYRWISEQEGQFAIMEYPVSPDSPAIAARRTFYSIYHWKNLIGGYSGWQSEENAARLRRLQRTFPGDAALDEMAGLGVRYVPVFEDRAGERRLQIIGAQPRLVPVRRFGSVQVYELDP